MKSTLIRCVIYTISVCVVQSQLFSGIQQSSLTCRQRCQRRMGPVCSTLGNTHWNECVLRCRGEWKQCVGPCPCNGGNMGSLLASLNQQQPQGAGQNMLNQLLGQGTGAGTMGQGFGGSMGLGNGLMGQGNTLGQSLNFPGQGMFGQGSLGSNVPNNFLGLGGLGQNMQSQVLLGTGSGLGAGLAPNSVIGRTLMGQGNNGLMNQMLGQGRVMGQGNSGLMGQMLGQGSGMGQGASGLMNQLLGQGGGMGQGTSGLVNQMLSQGSGMGQGTGGLMNQMLGQGSGMGQGTSGLMNQMLGQGNGMGQGTSGLMNQMLGQGSGMGQGTSGLMGQMLGQGSGMGQGNNGLLNQILGQGSGMGQGAGGVNGMMGQGAAANQLLAQAASGLLTPNSGLTAGQSQTVDPLTQASMASMLMGNDVGERSMGEGETGSSLGGGENRYSDCGCINNVLPVCTTTGVTRSNNCKAQCDGMFVACQGMCPCL